MGGEWDSTNVGDGQVAVFTPIALDHTKALGDTVEEIARTKSGIIKPSADVVSSAQSPEADRVLREASELTESTFAEQPRDFDVAATRVAVGGQLVTVRGRAATYEDVFLPLYGDHQAQNAAVAVAAVETFLGRGHATAQGGPRRGGVRHGDLARPAAADRDRAEHPRRRRAQPGGRCRRSRTRCAATSTSTRSPSSSESWATRMRGASSARSPRSATQFFVTRPDSERARDAEDLGDLVREEVGDEATIVYSDVIDALEAARDWAGEEARRAVVVAGSIVLVGQAMAYAEEQEWKQAAS